MTPLPSVPAQPAPSQKGQASVPPEEQSEAFGLLMAAGGAEEAAPPVIAETPLQPPPALTAKTVGGGFAAQGSAAEARAARPAPGAAPLPAARGGAAPQPASPPPMPLHPQPSPQLPVGEAGKVEADPAMRYSPGRADVAPASEQKAVAGPPATAPQTASGAKEQHTALPAPERSLTPKAAAMTDTLPAGANVLVTEAPVGAAPAAELATSGLRTQAAAQAGAPAPSAAPTPSPSEPTAPAMQVRAAIGAREGASRIELRLDPPELGRVQIEFEVRGLGQLRAVITVSETETMDLLRRHEGGLEQELKNEGFGEMAFEWRGGADRPARGQDDETELEAGPSKPITPQAPALQGPGTLNLTL